MVESSKECRLVPSRLVDVHRRRYQLCFSCLTSTFDISHASIVHDYHVFPLGGRGFSRGFPYLYPFPSLALLSPVSQCLLTDRRKTQSGENAETALVAITKPYLLVGRKSTEDPSHDRCAISLHCLDLPSSIDRCCVKPIYFRSEHGR